MRVRFEMSGGYGGLFVLEPLSVEIDSEELPEAERDSFDSMVRAATSAPIDAADAAGIPADLTTYRLSFPDGDLREIVMDERTVPSETWPLLEYLRELALHRRAAGG